MSGEPCPVCERAGSLVGRDGFRRCACGYAWPHEEIRARAQREPLRPMSFWLERARQAFEQAPILPLHEPTSARGAALVPGPHLLALGAQVEELYAQAHERTGVRRSECVAHLPSNLARELRQELAEMGARRGAKLLDVGLELEVCGVLVQEDPWLVPDVVVLRRREGVRGGLAM